MTPTPGPLDVASLLGAFHRRHEAVELALHEDLSIRLAERLRADELDLAFVSGIDAGARRRLDLRPLVRERLVLVVPKGHRLAERDAVAARELRAERFVSFPAGATIRETFAQVAARSGFAPEVAFETGDTRRTLALVAEGLGVAVLPASEALAAGPRAVVVGLRGRGLVHEILVATRSGRRLAPAAAELVRQALAR
jgi:DNA-binding transcriptional LysR family regulator